MLTRRGFMAGLAALPVVGRWFGECAACEQGPPQEYTVEIQGVDTDLVNDESLYWIKLMADFYNREGGFHPCRETAKRFLTFAVRVAIYKGEFYTTFIRLDNGSLLEFAKWGEVLVVGVHDTRHQGFFIPGSVVQLGSAGKNHA